MECFTAESPPPPSKSSPRSVTKIQKTSAAFSCFVLDEKGYFSRRFEVQHKNEKTGVKDQHNSHIIANKLLTIGSQHFACKTWDNEMQTGNGCCPGARRLKYLFILEV